MTMTKTPTFFFLSAVQVDTRMLLKGWQGLNGIPLDTADNTFKLVTDPASAKGKYYVDHRLCAPPQGARPRGDQDRLWDILEEECEKTLGNWCEESIR